VREVDYRLDMYEFPNNTNTVAVQAGLEASLLLQVIGQVPDGSNLGEFFASVCSNQGVESPSPGWQSQIASAMCNVSKNSLGWELRYHITCEVCRCVEDGWKWVPLPTTSGSCGVIYKTDTEETAQNKLERCEIKAIEGSGCECAYP
jgi:hypothetical protein